MSIKIALHGRTDVGQVREHNEDSFLVARLDDNERELPKLKEHELGEKGLLLVVCDGMGGAAAGEVASSMAVDAIGAVMLSDEVFAPPSGVTDDAKASLARKLRQAAREANRRIFRDARENLTRAGMGTTMTAVVFSQTNDHAVIAEVGDSRCYVWRKGKVTQVTRDQSLVNQLLETGHITAEQAKFFEHSNVILQALGVQEEVDVQLSKVELKKGDRFMLCSDGLSGVVTDEEIEEILGAFPDPEEATKILIEMANAAGGPDNITVIVAHVDGDLPEPTDADLLKYELWRIEPEVPPPEITVEASSQTFLDDEPTPPPAPPAPDDLAPQPRQSATLELVSMAVVVGLIVGSLITGAALYSQAVPCKIDAPAAGLSVVADGRPAGVVTVGDGSAELRLKPGHHQLTLEGAGAPSQGRDVNVEKGAVCELSFGTPR